MNKSSTIPYSPFNRTYKYLCLQNQLAHNKNKKQVKGLVNSNLSLNKKDIIDLSATRRSDKNHSKVVSHSSSFFSYSSVCDNLKGKLKQEPLVIHKNSKVNYFKGNEIEWQNKRISKKLSNTKCRVTPNKKTLDDYKMSEVYKTIAMRYDSNKNQNKQTVFFVAPSLTSTLALSDHNAHQNFCRLDSSRRKKINRRSSKF